MIKGCKQFFKRKAIRDFDAFLNSEFIDCFHFSIFYTEIIQKKKLKKKKKTGKKLFYKKPSI